MINRGSQVAIAARLLDVLLLRSHGGEVPLVVVSFILGPRARVDSAGASIKADMILVHVDALVVYVVNC